MVLSNWLNTVFESRRNKKSLRSRKRVARRIQMQRPSAVLEQLETRALLTDFAIDSVSVAEPDSGTTTLTFTVTRTNNTQTADVVLTYATSNDTAVSSSDYVGKSQTVTFTAGGADTKSIVITVNGDEVIEDDEKFNVNLSILDAGGDSITIAPSAGVGTITNNDTETLQISAPAITETDADQIIFLDVTSPKAVQDGFKVAFTTTDITAVLGHEYSVGSVSPVTFAGNVNETQQISVLIYGDNLIEPDETFSATLGSVTNTTPVQIAAITSGASATATITDDDTLIVEFDQATGSDDEEVGGNLPSLLVTGTIQAGHTVTVDVAVQGASTATSGTDFTAPTTLTVGSGSHSAESFAIPSLAITGDTVVEDDETIVLAGITGSQVTVGDANGNSTTVSSTTYTITDNDSATVSVAGTTQGNEAGPVNAVFTVTQTAASSVDTVISYTVGGTATSGSDYTALSGTVTIPAGDTTATITVPVTNDALVEETETVSVTLTAISAGDPQITLDADSANITASRNIADNDSATVSIAGTTQGDESGPVDAVFTVTMTAASASDTVVTYSVGGTATSGSDYTALTGSVTIAAGDTSATITAIVADDSLVEATETVIITFTGFSSGDADITLDADPLNLEATRDIADNDSATVSVSGTTQGDEEGPVDAVFTVTLTAASSTDTVVDYTVGGTATSGDDYVALTGSVTIAAGDTSATIIVDVTDDALVEATETVSITLTGVSAGDPQIALDADAANLTASRNIADNDSATVSVTGTTQGNEAGPVDAVFTVSLTAASSTDTVIDYTVGGTATSGSDYTALSGTVTIAAGDTTATITVPVTNDALVEETETVSVTLTAISAGDSQITLDADSANLTASRNIADNDIATVSIAGTTQGDEAGPVDAVFTVTMTAASASDTVVTYSVAGTATSGSDYTALTGSVTIAAGDTTATITVDVTDDSLVEATETVIVTLTGFSSGDADITLDADPLNLEATRDIADNDSATVSVSGTTQGDEEGPVAAVFTVTLTAASSTDTVVDYTVGGTATSGDDYVALTGSVTIAAGDTSATITVDVTDDALVEATETVSITLTGVSAGDPQIALDADPANLTASRNIADNDSATVSVTGTTQGNEAGPVDAVFTVSLTAASSTDTVVDYTVGGTATSGSDYTALSGTVTIPAGDTTATIIVPVTNDALVEETETVSVTLTAISAGDPQITLDADPLNLTASRNIADNDSATVSIAGTTQGDEAGPVDAVFTVTMTAASASDTVVTYSVAGTATSGSDYIALTGSVTIAAGDTTATITVDVTDDSLVEATETVIVTLTGFSSGDADITLDADPLNLEATRDIADNDSATVSVSGTTQGDEEGPVDAVFTVTLTAASSTDTVVDYTVGGTATSGDDYVALTGSVTIAAGDTSATIIVDVTDDALVEATETVSITLTGVSAGDPQIALDADPANLTASRDIADNDSATVSVAGTTQGNEAGPVDAVFTVSLTAASSTDTVIDYTVGGTATSGSDYTAPSGTITIPAGDTNATITVPVADDALIESNETITITLTGITAGDPQITLDADPANLTASRNIVDDDSATVSISGTTQGNEAGPVDAVFTVTMTGVSATDTVVTYSIGGTATSGSDYVALSGSVMITAGNTTATITVDVTDDSVIELTETVILTLTGFSSGDADITLDADPLNLEATRDITDNDSAFVSLLALTDGNEENRVDGVFGVTLSSVSSTDTIVAYTIGGSATSGDDYTPRSGSITILAGHPFAILSIPVIDDLLVEGTENVTVTLTSITSGDPGITLDSTPANLTQTVDIFDNDSATVSVAATTDGDEAGPVDGVFTVTLTKVSTTDTVVTYTVGGTATSGSDFTALSGTVTIAAGDLSATISVPVTDDSLIEATETVSVTLDGITAGNSAIILDPLPANLTASIDILDNDSGTVSIAGTTQGDEAGPVDAVFTVTLSAISSTDTVIAYSVGGTATSGSDYAALSGTVTILAGDTTATITVDVTDDALVEATETVTVTLTSITASDPEITLDVNPANLTASRDIADNDSATVSIAGTTHGDEAGPVNAVFTVTLTSASSTDTVVTYSVGGTAAAGSDYSVLSGSVTILAGDTTATITVAVTDDALVEATETLVVTLTGVSSGDADITLDADPLNLEATRDIADNDAATISVAGTTHGDEAGPVDAVFTVTLTAASSTDTVITYSVGGTATSGSDFAALSGSVTIAAGDTTATITVDVTDDALVEATETVTVTLTGITSSDPQITLDADPLNLTASRAIADNDSATVSIAATTPGDETGPVDAVFTVTMTAASSTDTVVTYSVGGTATSGSDYTALTGSVTITAGNTTATITVPVTDDALVEATETVSLTLTGITSGDPQIALDPNPLNDSAAIDITDNDSATVSITGTTQGDEAGPVDAVFTVTLTAASSTDTVVAYTVGGTATSGSDFAALSGTVTILAGDTTATITIDVTDDALVEATETVTITLSSISSGDADITLDATPANVTASRNIADNDSATASIATTTDGAEAGPVDVTFTVTLSAASSTDTVISYSLSGTAAAGTDYTDGGAGSITIPAGSTTGTITLTVSDDFIDEVTETAIVTLTGIASGDADITVAAGPNDSATGNIADDDTADITVTPTSGLATTEAGGTDSFTIVLTSQPTGDVTIAIGTSDATEGSATPISVTFTAANWNVPQTITVTGADDAIIDGDIAYTITTAPAVSTDGNYSGLDASDVSVTNEDDDVMITGTVDGSGNLVLDDLTGVDNAIIITVVGTDLIITDGNGNPLDFSAVPGSSGNGTNSVTVPLASFTAGLILNTGIGDDTLFIDFGDGLIIPLAGLTFNGGAGFDAIQLANVDDEFNSAVLNYTNPTDGSIDLIGANPRTITYTGLDPIVIAGPLVSITFNLTAGADSDATLSDFGGGQGQLTGSTFETTTFDYPVAGGTLTINTLGGDDTLTIASLALNATTNLIINGGANTDSVNFNAAGGLLNVNNLTVTAENIAQTTGITSAGLAAFTATNALTLNNVANDFATVVASSSGAITIADANSMTVGNVTGAGVTLSTVDALTLTGTVDAGAGEVSISVNTNAAGADSFTMQAGSSIVTTNDSATAVSIAVNTLGGGTGKATLTSISAGTTGGAAGGRVTVDANAGAITDGNLATNNITAGNAVLRGLAGVGTLNDPIETTVENLEGKGDTGGFFVTNSGDLTIGGIGMLVGIETTTGNIDVSANGSLTVEENVSSSGATGNIALTAIENLGTGRDLLVSAGVTISSPNGNIALLAGDNITTQATSVISAPSGTITIAGDSGDLDAEGAAINVASQLVSTGTTVSGGNDNDTYLITYPSGVTNSGTVTISDVGGTDAVTVSGTSGADQLFFTSSNPPTTLTTDQVTRGDATSEPVIIPSGIEAFTLAGGDGNDTFTVEPSTLFPITVDGGAPTFGGPTVPPGDTLNLQTFGKNISVVGNTVQVNGTGLKLVTVTNIENMPLLPASATPIQRYDFNSTVGGVQTPTQAGWTGMTSDRVYSAANGYGWKYALTSWRDGTSASVDANLINDGHLWTTSVNSHFPEFIANVPNGWVAVTLSYGHRSVAVDGLRIRNGDDNYAIIAQNLNSSAGKSNHVTVFVNVTDGTLNLGFDDGAPASTFLSFNGIDIRPAALFTMGLIDLPSGSVLGDGATIDTFHLAGGPANLLVTVAPSLGTVTTADADPKIDGTQVLTNALGEAVVSIKRPSGAGTSTILLTTPTGEDWSVQTIQYSLQPLTSNIRNLDFNTTVSGSATSTQSGYLPVAPSDSYTSARGFGWTTTPLPTPTSPVTVFAGPLAAAHNDFQTGSTTSTFRVDLPNDTYQVTLSMGDRIDHAGVDVAANGSAIFTDLALPRDVLTTQTFNVTVTNGRLDLTFTPGTSRVISGRWVINSIEIVPSSLIPPLTGTVVSPTSNAAAVTASQLAPLVEIAKAVVVAQNDLTSVQAIALQAATVRIADLSRSASGAATLGQSINGSVLIDDNGAGLGWDATSESVDADKYDLLSVLVHELGHVIGKDHEDSGVMSPSLTPGERFAVIDEIFADL